ncbi:MAG: alkaline phosphatase family protein [Leptospirales bacterium]
MRNRVIVLGLGGASLSLLKPWAEKGWLPNLDYFLRKGIAGPLDSPVPPASAPEWSALLTGRNPGKTGHFNRFSKEIGSYFPDRTRLSTLMTDGIWNLDNRNPIRTVLVDVPLVELSPKMVGLTLGEHRILTNDPETLQAFQKKILSRHWSAFRGRATNLHQSPDSKVAFVEQVIEETILLGRILSDLLELYPLEVVVLNFKGLDRLLPRFWKETQAVLSEEESESRSPIREAIVLFFKVLDDALGSVREHLNRRDLTIVFSGHGYAPLNKLLSLNHFLEEKGLLAFRRKGGGRGWLSRFASPVIRTIGVRRRNLKLLSDYWNTSSLGRMFDRMALPFSSEIGTVDWSNTRAFCLFQNGIHLNIRGLETLGTVPPGPEARNLGEKVIHSLLELRDPDTGQLVIHNVRWRDHLFEGPRLGELPHLILHDWNSSYQLADLEQARNSSSVFIRPVERDGVQKKEGFFILAGQIQVVAPGGPVSLLDIAPTILSALGREIPHDLDGTTRFLP